MCVKEDDDQTDTGVQINSAMPEENCRFSHNKRAQNQFRDMHGMLAMHITKKIFVIWQFFAM